MDAQTLEIQAVEVADNAIGNAPMLPHLLVHILKDELLRSIIVGGAYHTKACHKAFVCQHATAITLTHKNA